MRQLGIKISNSAVFFPPEAAPLLAHLGGAYMATQHYRDGRYVWEKSEEPPELLFLGSDVFQPEPEPMEKLRKEAEQATKNWLDYYHKNETLKKELAEAKAKLATIQAATGGATT